MKTSTGNTNALKKEIFINQFSDHKNRELLDDRKIVAHMKRNFTQMLSIGQRKYLVNLLCTLVNCCRMKSKDQYKWYMEKSQSAITQDLDLRKFLTSQRVTTTAILGLLTGRQSIFVDRMAKMIIREDDTQSSKSSSEGN